MLFYIFALVIFEVGSTFADSSATVIDEVIPQMMAGRGHEESIFHGTWVVMFVLSKVKRWPDKNWTFLLSCPATDFAAGTNRHNHPMLTGLSEVEKHVSTVVESRWGWWKHDPSWSIRTLVPRVSSEIPRSWTLCPLCWFISLIFHCWVYGVYA